jgi:micrococcal nuclease
VHDRLVASTFLDDKELGKEMIKAGLAWHFKKYSSDEILANLEIEARNNKKGLWVDPRPIAPWEIRRLHREGISTKDSFGVKQ